MTELIKFKMLQDELWKTLTPNNNCQPDMERREHCAKLIRQLISSEPANLYCTTKKGARTVYFPREEEPDRCSSCEFWSAHKRSGTCSQKVQLPMGKWDTQFTKENYGCTTYEKRGTVNYSI